jgi:hypothetical protein
MESDKPRPVFWKEMYWFTVICLGGWILAMAILPPRLARNRSAADMENDLRRAVAHLSKLEKEYEALIPAVENDPFYRDEVYRKVLRVKKTNEEFLKNTAVDSDN